VPVNESLIIKPARSPAAPIPPVSQHPDKLALLHPKPLFCNFRLFLLRKTTSLISAGKSWGESPALLEELRSDFSSSFGSSSTTGSVCSKGTLALGLIWGNPLYFFGLLAVVAWDLVCIFVR
jgi:hypothetical protein